MLGPAQGSGALDEAILAFGALPVVPDLGEGRLADVDARDAVQVMGARVRGKRRPISARTIEIANPTASAIPVSARCSTTLSRISSR